MIHPRRGGNIHISTHQATYLREPNQSSICGGYSKYILNVGGENFVERGMKMTDNFKINVEP
jgi:hypothetical protein